MLDLDDRPTDVPPPPASGTSAIRIHSLFEANKDALDACSRTRVAHRHASDFLARGAKYEREGKLAEAAFLYRQASGCEPVAARALHRCGQLERQTGHPKVAIATLKMALHHATFDPGLSTQIFIELGDLYAQLNDYEEAAYYLRRAARSAPDREDVQLRLRMAVEQMRAVGRRSPISGLQKVG